jgi:hypothetical protein
MRTLKAGGLGRPAPIRIRVLIPEISTLILDGLLVAACP